MSLEGTLIGLSAPVVLAAVGARPMRRKRTPRNPRCSEPDTTTGSPTAPTDADGPAASEMRDATCFADAAHRRGICNLSIRTAAANPHSRSEPTNLHAFSSVQPGAFALSDGDSCS